jgi:hypothetical protein
MAETTIILGDWNSVTPAAPAGSDNIAFAVDRTGDTPAFSASVPRATTSIHGTVLLDDWVELTESSNSVTPDCDDGKNFTLNIGEATQIENPTHPKGTILICVTGAGVVTLGDKFVLRSGDLTRSADRDYLIAIYNSAADKWDACWSTGTT